MEGLGGADVGGRGKQSAGRRAASCRVSIPEERVYAEDSR